MQRSGETGVGKPRAEGSRRAVGQDRWLGLVILVVSAFLFWETFSFKVVDWDPLGLPFWPRILLGLLGVIGVYLVVRGSLDDGPFQKLEGRAFLVLAGALAYVLLIDVLGYLLATGLYLALFHLVLGGISRRHLVEAAVMAVLATGLIYYVFQDALWVQFPEGLLFAEDL